MNIEEFVNDYLKEHRHDVLLNPYNGLIEFAKSFQQEMLKEAVDAIVEDWNPDPEPEITIPLNPEEFTCGDKVRVIVCKKED